MARYRHYRNPKQAGVPVFVTTTVLDFIHAFHREQVRDAMVFHLLRECRLQKAVLYGYVVMPHHLHLLLRPAPDDSISAFMKLFKPNTSREILKLLTPAETAMFDEQRGLNGNTFWQRSFRSIVIESEEMLQQKVAYIHQNPVRAGYVETEEDYRWSSARGYLSGLVSETSGIDYVRAADSLKTWAATHQSLGYRRLEAF